MNVSSWITTLEPSWIQSISAIATVVISLLALGFGLFNFWYGNWRKGKLIVSDPLSYALVFETDKPTREDKLMMFFPLILLNDGGITQFVQDIHVILHQNDLQSNELYFGRSYSSWDDNHGALAQQFVIDGHKAYSANFMFYQKPGGFVPKEGICKAEIKAKLNDANWEKIHEFTFMIDSNQKYRLIPRLCHPNINA